MADLLVVSPSPLDPTELADLLVGHDVSVCTDGEGHPRLIVCDGEVEKVRAVLEGEEVRHF